jgi:hypothetical protein
MHTAGSLSGPIGHVSVDAQFDAGLMPERVRAISAKLLHVKWATDYSGWNKVDRRTVYYHAFATPKVEPSGLLFEAQDLSPTKRSDLYLYFRASSGRFRHMRSRRSRRRIEPTGTYQPEATEQ